MAKAKVVKPIKQTNKANTASDMANNHFLYLGNDGNVNVYRYGMKSPLECLHLPRYSDNGKCHMDCQFFHKTWETIETCFTVWKRGYIHSKVLAK